LKVGTTRASAAVSFQVSYPIAAASAVLVERAGFGKLDRGISGNLA
jgi:hypothetical protein